LPEPLISPLPVRRNFDTDLFKRLARVDDLNENEEQLLKARWYLFRDNAQAYGIKTEDNGWFLAWLSAKAEEAVDGDWKQSPARGYFSHVLAVSYLMSTAAGVIPEIAQTGCAPVPEPNEILARAAGDLGLNFIGPHNLERRYAVLTPLPYSGGCSNCFLCGNCPQTNQTESLE